MKVSFPEPISHIHFPRFFERSLTFNGKIKCLSRIVVSPLDAQDVSAIVRFCAKHNLSPSIRAGGYGIAGWSVAGDVIIDLSLIKEVDIEAPIPIDEDEGGGTTWTRLCDMPAPGRKGKGKIGAGTVKVTAIDGPISRGEGADRPSISGPLEPITDPTAPRLTTPKRRREDRDETPPREASKIPKIVGLPVGIDAHLHAYDGASRTVGAFLRGPPLPSVPGEIPRGPPLNRRRLRSPTPEDLPAPTEPPKMPVLEDRQLSGNSVALSGSSGKESSSGSGSSRERSIGTAGTTPSESSGGENTSPGKCHATLATDPFPYLSNQPTSRPPVFGTSDPRGLGPRPTATFPSGSSIWSQPPGSGFSSTIWSSGVLATLYSAPNPFVASSSFPPTPGSFAMPMSHIIGMGGMVPAEPIHSHAYVTFGAGMRQKEVDLYTAEHPLEGTSRVTGMREEGLVPYHVPS